MKVKVIKRAYYNLEYLKEGAIIDFKGEKLPSWAVSVKENKKQETKTPDNVGQGDEVKTDKTPVKPEGEAEGENNAPLDNVGQGEGDTQKEVEYLEDLINKGIEKGILIDDADKKTVKEQIKELEELLKDEMPCA